MDSRIIIDALYSRKGFDDWWDAIDEDVQLEILEELDGILQETG